MAEKSQFFSSSLHSSSPSFTSSALSTSAYQKEGKIF
jgi:hypothetical protein